MSQVAETAADQLIAARDDYRLLAFPGDQNTNANQNTGVGGPHIMDKHTKLIALDFDGVLHSHTTPWTDAGTISDGPTPGAMRFLKALVDDDRFDVVIVSSRLQTFDGEHAVKLWLDRGLRRAFGDDTSLHIYKALQFSRTRPPAFVTIDDRGHQFDGTWPSLDALAAFKPWNKRSEAHVRNANDKPVSFASSSDLEGAIRYAREGGAGFETDAERNIAELGARRAISLLLRAEGFYDPAFVSGAKA